MRNWTHRVALGVLDGLAIVCRAWPFRGTGWLGPRVMGSLRPGMRSGSFKVRMRDGSVMVVPRSTCQAWAAAFTGLYESPLIGILARDIAPKTVVVDVGACLGFWTIPLAKQARSLGARVVAVEPVPGNVEVLRGNVERNGVEGDVTIVETALDATTGQLALWVENDICGNAGVGAQGPSANVSVDMDAQPLDEVLDHVVPHSWRVAAIKLDVEGWELRVLRGADETIRRDRPTILGEFSTWWQDQHGITMEQLFRWADEHGYRIFQCRLVRPHWWAGRSDLRVELLAGPNEFGSYEALLLRPEEERAHDG